MAGGWLSALQLFRPRTFARLGKTDARLQRQIEALSAEVGTLKDQVSRLTRQEGQLRAILEAQFGSDDQLTRFESIIRQSPIEEHARRAIAAAPISHEPFPHCVIDDLLPVEYYDALIAALPPAELFADGPDHREQLAVPFDSGPRYSIEVWRHMARVVAEGTLKPALLAKFHEPLTNWLRETLPVLGEQPLDHVRVTASDGRILLRRPGDRISPHRDPKWGLITCLVYLAREGDDERWGTQLFTVDKDEEAAGARPHWISEARCQLVSEIPFRPNRALVFLNTVGAHGAHIAADGNAATRERYAYQFRIGVDKRSIRLLRTKLPPERLAFWTGKVKDDYTVGGGSQTVPIGPVTS